MFQQDMVTIWAGPQDHCMVAGVLKIYITAQDAAETTKIFSKTFKK
jgi:hypothetical protein